MKITVGKTKLSLMLLITLTIALTVMACLLLYSYDNKYTAAGPQAWDGVLALNQTVLAEHPVLFLLRDWEYYGGRLLTPADFAGADLKPDQYIYIGEYGGFDAGDFTKPPHGSASYRMTIILPEKPQTYTLELPEIFSAYRLYINDKLAMSMGDPDPGAYRPATGNRTVSVEAGGPLTILLAVSDFSRLYSGLTYPPAFGAPAAVSALLNERLIFRSLLAAFALGIGLLAVLTGFWSKKNKLAILYGLFCLCFVGYTAYPLWQSLPINTTPFYGIENLSYCAMLTTVIALQQTLYREKRLSAAPAARNPGHLHRQSRSYLWLADVANAWSENISGKFFVGFGLAACLASLILPLLLAGGSFTVIAAYSYLITAFQWLAALFLTVTNLRAVKNSAVYSRTLLCGFLILDTALVMDRLLPLYEPIRTAWFPEMAGFMLLLCLGLAVGLNMAEKYRDSVVLTERAENMERLLTLQKANFDLLTEQIEATKTIRHDIRHHFMMMDGYLQNRRYEKLSAYIAQYSAAIVDDDPVAYSPNDVVNVLAHHYFSLAHKQGVKVAYRLELARDTGIADVDLCTVVSNLLENALEVCARQQDGARFIEFSIVQQAALLSINMLNSAGEVHLNGGKFLSAKKSGRKGYGLQSIQAIAAKYAGEAEFHYDAQNKAFRSTVLLINISRLQY